MMIPKEEPPDDGENTPKTSEQDDRYAALEGYLIIIELKDVE